MTILSSVGAGGMETDERNALARLFEIEPVWPAAQAHMHIAPKDRVELGAHGHAVPARCRGAASTSLK